MGVDREYTLDELEGMTLRELCEVAAFLGIIKLSELVDEIYDMRGKEA